MEESFRRYVGVPNIEVLPKVAKRVSEHLAEGLRVLGLPRSGEHLDREKRDQQPKNFQQPHPWKWERRNGEKGNAKGDEEEKGEVVSEKMNVEGDGTMEETREKRKRGEVEDDDVMKRARSSSSGQVSAGNAKNGRERERRRSARRGRCSSGRLRGE